MIILDLDVKDKLDLLQKISHLAKEAGVISDATKAVEDFYDKEKNTETYLGEDCAIPHVRTSNVKKDMIIFVRTKKTIKWADDENAKYIFAIFAKEESIEKHIDMLMHVSKLILNKDILKVLKNSENPDELGELLK